MIRRCRDADLIDEMDRACFPSDERLTPSELHDAEWWVLDETGYVGVLCGHLVRYGVLPSARCAGTGLRLLQHVRRTFAKRGLPVDTYVMATNVPSIRCLLRAGFVITHATYDHFATYLHVATGPKR